MRNADCGMRNGENGDRENAKIAKGTRRKKVATGWTEPTPDEVNA